MTRIPSSIQITKKKRDDVLSILSYLNTLTNYTVLSREKLRQDLYRENYRLFTSSAKSFLHIMRNIHLQYHKKIPFTSLFTSISTSIETLIHQNQQINAKVDELLDCVARIEEDRAIVLFVMKV